MTARLICIAIAATVCGAIFSAAATPSRRITQSDRADINALFDRIGGRRVTAISPIVPAIKRQRI
jgi:hypothetical protein